MSQPGRATAERRPPLQVWVTHLDKRQEVRRRALWWEAAGDGGQGEDCLVPDHSLLHAAEVLKGAQQDVAVLYTADVGHEATEFLRQGQQDLVLIVVALANEWDRSLRVRSSPSASAMVLSLRTELRRSATSSFLSSSLHAHQPCSGNTHWHRTLGVFKTQRAHIRIAMGYRPSSPFVTSSMVGGGDGLSQFGLFLQEQGFR